VALSFETGEAVDDIRCVLADGTVLRLQAKRACGADEHLAATVVQWMGQVGDLRQGDKVGLATAEPKGVVRDLGAALDRRRRSVPGPLLPGEKKALEAVRGKLPRGTPTQVADQVLDAAVVMGIAVSSARDEGFRSVANLSDGTVVPIGSGLAAVGALQHAFQAQAAAGAGSAVDDWLQILKEAGLQVFPDAEGAAGPRRRAELDAVTAHRGRLASRDGIVEFSLLADDLPKMRYAPLVGSLRVTVPGQRGSDAGFLATARRWPRMLLTGLPGMGKTTALEQAAARWAADSSAPIPVVVPLREVARQRPRGGTDVSLRLLVEVGTRTAPEHERVPLRRALERAAASGDAVLLLDGLDECGDRRAVVADGLAAVIDGLPADTGVVLATRDSGRLAAGRLNMPEARLTEPAQLELVLGQILAHAACRISEEDRGRWVRQREEQLEDIRGGHPDLFSIPLFAVLLTLLLAQPLSRTLPRGRARLLADAVGGTVDQWELRRLEETGSRPGMRGGQLLDGFREIGHALISRPGGCPAELACRQIEAMLAEQWGLAPGEARERARDILWFWDEHVGVFIGASGTGVIEPRSRVFAETGEAMWAAARSRETQRAWISAALAGDDYREPVVLACGLSADLAGELIDAAAQAEDPAPRERALGWAADATIDGAQPPARSLSILVGVLAQVAASKAGTDAGEHGDAGKRRGAAARPAWRYALQLAMLPLPAGQRSRRDQLLSGLLADGYERAITAALAALADAGADARNTLEPGQEAAVRNLLALPLPERKPPLTVPAARPGHVKVNSQGKLLPGLHEVALQAARYAAQLGQDAAAAIYRIAYRGYFRDYALVHSRLKSLGYEPPPDIHPAGDLRGLISELPDIWEKWPAFLAAAASLGQPRLLANIERWRYPNVAVLGNVLLMQEGTVVGVNRAFTSEQMLMRGCMMAAAHAVGLDLPAISAEAAVALKEWNGGNRDLIDVMFAPRPYPSPALDTARLDRHDKDILIEALGAASDWLANTACDLLLSALDPSIGQQAADRIGEIPPSRRVGAAMVAIANDPSPPEAASRLLDAGDPLVRVGSATAARMLAQHGSTQAWASVLARAQTDDDQKVRLAAGADPATAGKETYWSCEECGQVNETAARQCSACREVAHLRIIETR